MSRPDSGGLAFEAEEKEKAKFPGSTQGSERGLVSWLWLPSQGGRSDFLLRKGSHWTVPRPWLCFRVFSEDVLSKLWRPRGGRRRQRA